MDKSFKDALTDSEKGKLFAFAQDKNMMAAVKKIMLYDLFECGHTTVQHDAGLNWVYNLVDGKRTDEQLGQELKAHTAGLGFVLAAFKRLEEFGIEETKSVDETNPAI